MCYVLVSYPPAGSCWVCSTPRALLAIYGLRRWFLSLQLIIMIYLSNFLGLNVTIELTNYLLVYYSILCQSYLFFKWLYKWLYRCARRYAHIYNIEFILFIPIVFLLDLFIYMILNIYTNIGTIIPICMSYSFGSFWYYE